MTSYAIRGGEEGKRRLALLLVVNGTALSIYRETGGWNQFHTLAVISVATLLLALGGFVVVGERWWWLIAIALAAWLFLWKVPRDVADARPVATAQ